MALFILGWLFLIFYGMNYTNKIEDTSSFTKETVVHLKGISAVEIMIGHIGLSTGSIFLYPNRKAGILFVGIFLAVSGYGLMYSKENKPDYMNHFLSNRLKKVMIPAYIVYLLGIIIKTVQSRNLEQILFLINPIKIFQGINWYVWEIILLYIAFYFSGKLLKNYTVALLMVSILFVCIAFILKVDNPWYGSTLCFWLGMWYYQHQKQVLTFLNKTYYIPLIIGSSIIIFSMLMFFILGEDSICGNLIARNIASITFVSVVIILLYKFHIGNAFSYWCGMHSYEIFLFHIMYIGCLNCYMQDFNFLFGIVVSCLTFLSSYLYKKFETLGWKVNK